MGSVAVFFSIKEPLLPTKGEMGLDSLEIHMITKFVHSERRIVNYAAF